MLRKTKEICLETAVYTMTDRDTFLALQENLLNLVVLVGGDNIADNQYPALLNPFAVNPDKGNINNELAEDFVTWLTSLDIQQQIAEFGVEEFG